MKEGEKSVCINQIKVHKKSVKKFRAIISYIAGNLRKGGRNIFLRSLGYRKAALPDSKNDSAFEKPERLKEKEMVRIKCVEDFNGAPTISFWRSSSWDLICNESMVESLSSDFVQAEKEISRDGSIDNIFMTEAARRAFKHLRGYPLLEFADCDSSSIIALARADAGTTTMLIMITIGGKGGSRNDLFIESFRKLLPKSLDTMIRDMWNDLSDTVPHELRLFLREGGSGAEDPFSNSLRDWTIALKSPQDSRVYLLATAKYFREKVCSWMG